MSTPEDKIDQLTAALQESIHEATKAKAQVKSLIKEYFNVLGYEPEDKSFLHALLHIRNAVLNQRADLSVALLEVEDLKKKLNEAEAEILRLKTEKES
jgi:regulator of sirC expression with transglutaminase-like and TPR domain